MALRKSAPIALRPHRAWRLAITVAPLLVAAGCGSLHRRSSLRPVYTAPAAVAAPCRNCGSGSASGAVLGPPAVGAPAGRSLSSEPVIEEPAGSIDSTVPSLDAPTGASRSQSSPRRNGGTGSERAPSASIGDEPGLDMLPSQSVKPRSPRGSSSSAPAPEAGIPPLNGPGAAPRASSAAGDGVRTASATSRVRRASARDRLKPYLESPEGDELFYPNKADRPWKYIVLHHSANASGGIDQIDQQHRKVLGYDGCGYHFVIGNGTGSEDGQIEVAQRWVNQKHGVHCRNAKNAEIDEYGIGVCFVGDLDREPPTPRQLAAARELVAYLASRYNIAPARVETHAHLAATPTVCPGRHFPSASLLAARPVAPESATIARRPVPTAWRVRESAGTVRD